MPSIQLDLGHHDIQSLPLANYHIPYEGITSDLLFGIQCQRIVPYALVLRNL